MFDHGDDSSHRPRSVTVIAWFTIVPAVAIILMGFGRLLQGVGPGSASLILLAMGVAQLLVGIGLLKGIGWARTLYLWLTPVLIAVGFVRAAAAGDVTTATVRAVTYMLFYALVLYFLTRPAAATYFGGRR